ncbi:hypothetical protein DWZ10_06100 [Segatella copri]|nr:hypothetical protein DWZ10_06100 [Segatella copri]
MGMLVASFRVPYRGMPIIACYQFQAAKLRFFPETTKYFLFFLRNILEMSIIRRFAFLLTPMFLMDEKKSPSPLFG